MQRLIALLLTAAVVFPLAAKEKHKIKEKRFDPAPLARLSDAAGRYAGPDAGYVIELSFAGRKLSGFMMLEGVRLPLANIDVAGSSFEATRGGEPVRGRFVNRVLNGASAFGLLLEAPPFSLGDGAVTPAFYRRVTP